MKSVSLWSTFMLLVKSLTHQAHSHRQIHSFLRSTEAELGGKSPSSGGFKNCSLVYLHNFKITKKKLKSSSNGVPTILTQKILQISCHYFLKPFKVAHLNNIMLKCADVARNKYSVGPLIKLEFFICTFIAGVCVYETVDSRTRTQLLTCWSQE